MTSARGNKSLVISAGICITLFVILLGALISERRQKIKLYEKKYSVTSSELEKSNQNIMSEIEAYAYEIY